MTSKLEPRPKQNPRRCITIPLDSSRRLLDRNQYRMLRRLANMVPVMTPAYRALLPRLMHHDGVSIAAEDAVAKVLCLTL
jgi:hypothetical protein